MKYLLVLFMAAWAAGAIAYPSALNTPLRWSLLMLWALFSVWVCWQLWHGAVALPLVAFGVVFAGIAIWWLSLQPSGQRAWADDVAHMAVAEVRGDIVTLPYVRNFDWRSDSDYTVRWQSRRYDLRQLTSTDLFVSYWAGPSIAHTLVSFGFRDGQQLVFSIEVRKERAEQFSELAGFFKGFELSVIAADEHDIVRVRSEVRHERVHLYRVALSPEVRRALFLAYVKEANTLQRQPSFYSTLTSNCTTKVFQMMRRLVPDLPLDYRLLASGYLPRYVYEQKGLDTRYSLEALTGMGNITGRAEAAPNLAYSQAIRQGIPPLHQANSND